MSENVLESEAWQDGQARQVSVMMTPKMLRDFVQRTVDDLTDEAHNLADRFLLLEGEDVLWSEAELEEALSRLGEISVAVSNLTGICMSLRYPS